MTNINFLINSAQFIISLLDLKQQLLTGNIHSNVIFSNQKNIKRQSLTRSSKEIRDPDEFYQNPLLSENSPDPGVVKLQDGSGWAMVTTTNNATYRSSAFPIYFSKGGFTPKSNTIVEKLSFSLQTWWTGGCRAG